MIFKVIGKSVNGIDVISEETIKRIKDIISEDDEILYIDISTDIGQVISQNMNVCFIPTVICVDENDVELGYIENEFSTSSSNNYVWYQKLDDFVYDMMDLKEK